MLYTPVNQGLKTEPEAQVKPVSCKQFLPKSNEKSDCSESCTSIMDEIEGISCDEPKTKGVVVVERGTH